MLSYFMLFSLWVVLVTCIPGDMIHDKYKIRHTWNQSIKKPFFFKDNTTIPFFDTFGSVSGSPNSLMLNDPVPNESGAIWSQQPNNLNEWAVVMNVNIKGEESVTSTQGMAFWYTQGRGQLGPIFGSIDKWVGMGIFMDSFGHNGQSKNPAILAVYNDGSSNYYTGQAFAHCFKSYRNPLYSILVKIVYSNRTLSVEVDSEGHGHAYKKCFEYSPIHLTTGYYFGVSAAAGPVPDTHELISLDVYEVNPKGIVDESVTKPKYDSSLLKKHEEIQKKLKDSILKKEKASKDKVDWTVLYATLARIEENQQYMVERLENFIEQPDVVRPNDGTPNTRSTGTGSDMVSLSQRLYSLESQMNALLEHTMAIGKTLQELSGSHQGSQSIISQVAQLNQLTHNKLSSLEDTSKKSNEKAEEIHQVIQDKEKTYLYYFMIFVILQCIVFVAYLWAKKKDSSSSFDKKFI